MNSWHHELLNVPKPVLFVKKSIFWHIQYLCEPCHMLKWTKHMTKKVHTMKNVFEEEEKNRRTVWEVTSHIQNDEGEDIFTEKMINDYLDKHKNVKWYAWIVHDKDVYTEEDKLKDTTNSDKIKVGKLKPRHIHLVLQFSSRMRRETLARAFNLPIGFVCKPKVYKTRLQVPAIVTYFTHEKESVKYIYDVSLIHSSNPEQIRPMIDDFKENHPKQQPVSKKSRNAQARKLIDLVSKGEITLPEIKESWGLSFYLDFEPKFLKARHEFMKMKFKMKPRINFYIEGGSGVGKSTVARMLAMTLGRKVFAKQMEEDQLSNHHYEDYELYFEVGESKVRFDAYEYQPILIWNDVRYDDLLKEFNREGVLNLLELSPTKRNYNIKYGGVILSNQVNIFNGISDNDTFIGGLAREYKDSSGTVHEGESEEQAFRRFPIILHVHADYIEIKIRKKLEMLLSQKPEVSSDDNIVNDSPLIAEQENHEISTDPKYSDSSNADESNIEGNTDSKSEHYQLYKLVKVNISKINQNYASKAFDKISMLIMEPVIELYEEYMTKIAGDADKIINPEYISPVTILDRDDAIKYLDERKTMTDEDFEDERLNEDPFIWSDIQRDISLESEFYHIVGESTDDASTVDNQEDSSTSDQHQYDEQIKEQFEIYKKYRHLYDVFENEPTKIHFNKIIDFIKTHQDFLMQFPYFDKFIKVAENARLIESHDRFIDELKSTDE